MNDFYSNLAEILEVDEVKPDDVLQDFEIWDSLTEICILAMLDSNCGVNLTAGELRQMKTVAALVATVESQMQK